VRIVFFGTPSLAVPSLAGLVDRHEVAAVVCQPDKPKGRSGAPAPPPVKEWALRHGIPVHQPVKLNDGAFEAWLRELAPDACAVVAYGRLLKQPLLDVPHHGHFNMHPSLLPRWRGPSPIQSAVMAGDRETGVTIIRLNLDMDAGDIVLQERVDIGDEEDAETLTERLSALGARMLADTFDQVEAGTARFTPQSHEAATYCGMLSKEDGYIDWRRSAVDLHNLVRGALPWPVAQCAFRGAPFKIYASRLADAPQANPGEIVGLEQDAIRVATGQGTLAITRLQAPGKRVMTTREFLPGARLQLGERFDMPGQEVR
jgi:methionyl-tRNA formyltransferase